MTSIGFLHTSPVHVERFERLVAESAPDVEVVTVVDEVLLDRARSHGLADLILIGGLADRLAQLAEVDVVVCTCSTIGGLAEEIGAAAGLAVARVDRAMAEGAVAIGGRIAVVAAVASTVGPTVELLETVATANGADVTIDVVEVAGAWDRFEAGDLAGYESAVAEVVRACATDADVVVLAQASMASVADRDDVATLDTPVLTSPRAAVAAAVLGLTR